MRMLSMEEDKKSFKFAGKEGSLNLKKIKSLDEIGGELEAWNRHAATPLLIGCIAMHWSYDK